ncbi:hypothetical protein HA402_005255 [Bradysia odoriphaga]|nr:hypothetical protein HA402_005255 [Bradysia odoriphaga]
MATITFRSVSDFNQLSLEEAINIIYEELIPACEEKGVLLSQYGNHAGGGTIVTLEEYERKRECRNLFDLKRIQKAFVEIDEIIRPTSDYKISSYGFKHIVEKHGFEPKYISNGDVIVTMLLKGYAARFGKRNEPIGVNCEFKAAVLKKR